MAKKSYDWKEIEFAFLHSSKSLKDIAEEFDVSYETVRQRAVRGKWQEKRHISSQSVTEKAMQIVEDTRALQLAEFTQRDLDRVSELQEEMRKLIPLIEKPSDLKSITGALLDLQKCYRLALGASTENQSTTSDVSFEQWLNGIENGEYK